MEVKCMCPEVRDPVVTPLTSRFDIVKITITEMGNDFQRQSIGPVDIQLDMRGQDIKSFMVKHMR